MHEELEKLEKQFILDHDAEPEEIRTLVSRILKFCKIDPKGYVIIRARKLSKTDKIMLVLAARYLACNLQRKLGREAAINQEVSNKELADMLQEKPTIVRARLKDLKKDSKIVRTESGVHKAAGHSISEFLERLEGPKNDG
jgi:hypothetical protein